MSGLYEQIKDDLGYLQWGRATECFAALAEQALQEQWSHVEFLALLAGEQADATRNRRLAARLRYARFPYRKTLDDFDFEFQPTVDRKLVEVGRVFRLSPAAMVSRILLPAVLPQYVVSLRQGLGLGWMFVVAAELLGASEGLGYLLIDGQQLGKPAQIVAAIVAFAIIGKTTDWIISAVTAPLLRWEDAFVRL